MNFPAVLRPLYPVCFSAAAAAGLCLFAGATAPGSTPVPKPSAAAAVPAPATALSGSGSTLEVPATDLNFNEFFRWPIGPRGLEFSEKLHGLNGQRVRLTGHMVNHLHADPRVFILSSVPLKFHQCEYGLCDDLPATALHVHVPGNPRDRVAFVPGEIVLTGRLSVGNVEELDGRLSAVRLFLDPVQATALRTVAATAGTVR